MKYRVTYVKHSPDDEPRTEEITAERFTNKGEWIEFFEGSPPVTPVTQIRASDVERVDKVT